MFNIKLERQKIRHTWWPGVYDEILEIPVCPFQARAAMFPVHLHILIAVLEGVQVRGKYASEMECCCLAWRNENCAGRNKRAEFQLNKRKGTGMHSLCIYNSGKWSSRHTWRRAFPNTSRISTCLIRQESKEYLHVFSCPPVPCNFRSSGTPVNLTGVDKTSLNEPIIHSVVCGKLRATKFTTTNSRPPGVCPEFVCPRSFRSISCSQSL
ncbi:hypothetical protein CBL_12868 [Carabus blaptoides fortunei]